MGSRLQPAQLIGYVAWALFILLCCGNVADHVSHPSTPCASSALVAASPTTTAARSAPVITSSEDHQPEGSQKTYRRVMLRDQMPVLLITDPEAKDTEIELRVSAGSREDPVGRKGTLHLIEHLIGRSSKKFPEDDIFLQTSLLKPIFYFDAVTDSMATTYTTKVSPADTGDALDLLSAVLEAPRIDTTSVLSELFAVDHEWSRKRRDLEQQIFALSCMLAHPAHPYGRTGGGNQETLLGDGTIEELTALVQATFAEVYRADRMSMVIRSSLDSDTLTALVAGFASPTDGPDRLFVPSEPTLKPLSLDRSHKEASIPLFNTWNGKPSQITKVFWKGRPQMKLTWQLPGLRRHADDATKFYLENTLFFDEVGLMHRLAKDNLVAPNSQIQPSFVEYENESIFSITLHLTPRGAESWSETVAIVLQYLNTYASDVDNGEIFHERAFLALRRQHQEEGHLHFHDLKKLAERLYDLQSPSRSIRELITLPLHDGDVYEEKLRSIFQKCRLENAQIIVTSSWGVEDQYHSSPATSLKYITADMEDEDYDVIMGGMRDVFPDVYLSLRPQETPATAAQNPASDVDEEALDLENRIVIETATQRIRYSPKSAEDDKENYIHFHWKRKSPRTTAQEVALAELAVMALQIEFFRRGEKESYFSVGRSSDGLFVRVRTSPIFSRHVYRLQSALKRLPMLMTFTLKQYIGHLEASLTVLSEREKIYGDFALIAPYPANLPAMLDALRELQSRSTDFHELPEVDQFVRQNVNDVFLDIDIHYAVPKNTLFRLIQDLPQDFPTTGKESTPVAVSDLRFPDPERRRVIRRITDPNVASPYILYHIFVPFAEVPDAVPLMSMLKRHFYVMSMTNLRSKDLLTYHIDVDLNRYTSGVAFTIHLQTTMPCLYVENRIEAMLTAAGAKLAAMRDDGGDDHAFFKLRREINKIPSRITLSSLFAFYNDYISPSGAKQRKVSVHIQPGPHMTERSYLGDLLRQNEVIDDNEASFYGFATPKDDSASGGRDATE